MSRAELPLVFLGLSTYLFLVRFKDQKDQGKKSGEPEVLVPTLSNYSMTLDNSSSLRSASSAPKEDHEQF